ncbi:SDR family NAD(P)-dependent oxidoreductase [Herbiconiux flava]|uniref:NAD(P)-dependent dehydrogenase (Short-subunit alcohol dehydrogenase family) n=1 Tax=Herbiconiux flava TaxID=881268 RepID=A0A852S7V2_9MICO|nr:SDR family NAD(P)-dependent oxidoreductase [Herbiconiux flava]NYD69338.1 NAD(P)-dependent dehydrogenase (short-subunit alcohol dehydrogenase family) [Herbiconiux flava]
MQDKVAIITGAGGALGRATALRLGADGFAIGALGRASADLAETAAQLEAEGFPVRMLEVDLRDSDAIEAAVAGTERDFGPVGALINNAAIYPSTPFLEIPLAEYDDVVTVNQRGYFYAAQVAARGMVARRSGAIVNVGSITWHGGWSNLASYVSTKGAAVALTRALARELGEHGIRVNAVSPGAFPTKAEEIQGDAAEYSAHVIEHQALKRRGSDAELAAVVSFLVGPDSSFVTGQTINVDGGWIME